MSQVSEILVKWTPNTSGRAKEIQIRSRIKGTTEWSPQGERVDPALGELAFTSNAPATAVEVQCRMVSVDNIPGDWFLAEVTTAPAVIEYATDIEGAPEKLGDLGPEGLAQQEHLESIETGATVGAPEGTNVAGRPAEDVVRQIDAIAAGGFADYTPPPVPTNLVLSSTLTEEGATLKAVWNASVADDLAGYRIAIEGEGAFRVLEAPENSWESSGAKRDTVYKAKVLARDKAGNLSNYSEVVTHTTVRDDVPPALPTNLKAEATFEAITIRWTNPVDLDLVTTEVWTNTSNSTASARLLASTNARPSTLGAYTHNVSSPTVGNYYWLVTVDSSKNRSGFSSALGPVKTVLVDISDVAPAVSTGLLKTVQSLPNEQGYVGPPTVQNAQDGKLYRYVDGKWTKSVAVDDFDSLITKSLIDSRGLDIKAIDGATMFGSDGRISDRVTVTGPNGSNISLSAIAANALTPSLHYVGEFDSPPTQAQLGAEWKQNAVYKNTQDARSYVLTGEPLGWEIYLVDGQSFTLVIESTNGTVFRVGQAQTTLLKARLFKNGAEVTDTAPESWFRWRRVSAIPRAAPNDDATFNAKYAAGYKSISINIDDIYSRATFFVDAVN